MTFKDETVRCAVPLPGGIKERQRDQRAVRALWTSYRGRRERYQRIAEERGLVYSVARTTAEVRARMARRGYTPRVRTRGDVHTFALFPSYGWQKHLLPDLHELGPVTHFDFETMGFRAEQLAGPPQEAAGARRLMFELVMPAIRAVHAERPIDGIFRYGGGQDTSPSLDSIVDEMVAAELAVRSARAMSSDNPPAIRRVMPIPSALKERLRAWGPARTAWTAFRARQVEDEYRRRRDHYARLAAERSLVYSEVRTTAEVRARLAARGYTPTRRARGDVHTFASIPMYGWHEHLLPDLLELGPLTHFDYTKLGYDFERFAATAGEPARLERSRMNGMLVDSVRHTHAVRAIDWIFLYGGGQDYSPTMLRRLADELGIPVVNMSLDDKHGFVGGSAGDARTGAIDISIISQSRATWP